MSEACSHLDEVADVAPSSEGCEDCLRIGGQWVHLRMCMSCGHVGCCDNSPHRHATAHFTAARHPIIQSYEPGEDWWFCYLDDLAFLIEDAPSFRPSMSTGHATAVTEPADLPVERRGHPADIAEPTPVTLAVRAGTPITTPQWEGTAS